MHSLYKKIQFYATKLLTIKGQWLMILQYNCANRLNSQMKSTHLHNFRVKKVESLRGKRSVGYCSLSSALEKNALRWTYVEV